jgi:hypothetical protein
MQDKYTKPIKDRTAPELLKAFQFMEQELVARGLKPKLMKLDNEASNKSFPMHLWDRILPQAVITLNMLRTSRMSPKLSAAMHLFGQYDFNRAPMAPPGTRSIAHETPGRRITWAPHDQDGCYIGPALEHYRCYTVYITKTRSNRTVETVEFTPPPINSNYHSLRLANW